MDEIFCGYKANLRQLRLACPKQAIDRGNWCVEKFDRIGRIDHSQRSASHCVEPCLVMGDQSMAFIVTRAPMGWRVT
jgi:hypothetical protein